MITVAFVKIVMVVAVLVTIYFVYALLKKNQKTKSKNPDIKVFIAPPKKHSEKTIAATNEQNDSKKPAKSHRKHRDKPYQILCSEAVFSSNELDILKEYGSWLSALALEEIKPDTDSQREFVELCKNYQNLPLKNMFLIFKNSNKDMHIIQLVWFKYLCRIQYEIENSSIIENPDIVFAMDKLLHSKFIRDVQL
ncbi:DUF413 domain-containing protein [Pseudomonas weihenstephanensis]|uniref:DUF413 domain-containing protein n=1 Tax=Pseudomonas weihenstephanensis TaxID=1608994 RepID=UPI000653293E|nr:DUF413 domain-containing protein [Pseudomonas weihenstephanensis]KMN16025.1 hypothetical protein TU87_22695 [Pseudomonas weihenstephanensis]